MSLNVIPATADHRVFIECNWVVTFEKHALLARRDSLRYRRTMPTIIECLRLEDGAETLVAVDATDPDFYVGFACLKGNELHYVYVKHALSRMGVVARLLEGREIRYISHKTPELETRLRPEERGWTYRPRLVI